MHMLTRGEELLEVLSQGPKVEGVGAIQVSVQEKERTNYIQDQPLRLQMGKGPIKTGPNSNTSR